MNMPWPMYFGFLAALVGNILWYWMKFINKAKGYKTSYWSHSGDFKNFKEVIAKEVDQEKKRKYKQILNGNYACIAMLIASFLATVAITINE